MAGFGIFRRKEKGAAIKVDMSNLNFDKLADPTAQLINNLKHQFVLIVVNGIKKKFEFIEGEVANYFSKPLIVRLLSGFSFGLYRIGIIVKRLHNHYHGGVIYINVAPVKYEIYNHNIYKLQCP